ncbi:hypothetical protein [Saccharothrix xinjiangensis]|uniref:Uncharacterized protein n=1 Tax=Saccharothrix xinjiangensis TaxID=204798 RepID=A0ABV9XZ78_9PSEU
MNENKQGEGSRDDSRPVADDLESFSDRAFSAVPELGSGRRWQDALYNVLSWIDSSWRAKLVPHRGRRWINRRMVSLMTFRQAEVYRAWSPDDPRQNLIVADDEHVHIPALWLVEFFPPSQFENLASALKRKSWGEYHAWTGSGPTGREILEQSRTGKGWSWWRLADVIDPDSDRWSPDSLREKLPDHFDQVSLIAIQIGAGLTAVLARFDINKESAKAVDDIWHETHEPEVVRNFGRPMAQGRMWTKFRKTQQARRSIHDAARRWLADSCPGFFAAHSRLHPLVDLILTEQGDPFADSDSEAAQRESMRALGLTDYSIRSRTSGDLPGLVVEPASKTLTPTIGGAETWAIWGNRNTVEERMENLAAYGGGGIDGIVHVTQEHARNFFVLLAVSRMAMHMDEDYARLRDEAQTRHGRFKGKGLKLLRASFLTLSLDLTSVARDLQRFHGRKWRDTGDAQFMVGWFPQSADAYAAQGGKVPEPTSMNEELEQRQSEWFEDLIAADRDYREILSTVAALGASNDSLKISRVALWLAFVSLMIAMVTLLVAEVKPQNLLSFIVEWVASRLR